MNFPGNCFFNHNKKKVWIDIPKNASKSIGYHLRNSQDWKNGNYIEENIYNYKAYAVVRDPIKRWKGSTIEIAYHYVHYTKYDYSLLERWFAAKNWKNFEKINDLHHKKLDYFTNGLQDITWISLDNTDFEQNIKYHLGIEEDLVKLNSTEENEAKKYIEPYVNEILSDSEFVIKLKNFYATDYEILNSIN